MVCTGLAFVSLVPFVLIQRRDDPSRLTYFADGFGTAIVFNFS